MTNPTTALVETTLKYSLNMEMLYGIKMNRYIQVISHRYEQGSIILTTNKKFKKWPEIFDNDSTLTSAVLDRLLHHADYALIEGPSYRMKDRIEA